MAKIRKSDYESLQRCIPDLIHLTNQLQSDYNESISLGKSQTKFTIYHHHLPDFRRNGQACYYLEKYSRKKNAEELKHDSLIHAKMGDLLPIEFTSDQQYNIKKCVGNINRNIRLWIDELEGSQYTIHSKYDALLTFDIPNEKVLSIIDSMQPCQAIQPLLEIIPSTDDRFLPTPLP